MLRMIIRGTEYYNEETETFEDGIGDFVLELEHSLISLSKWESKYKKPFLSQTSKSTEETFFYIQCMILDANFSPEVLNHLTKEHFTTVSEYIESTESATTFGKMPPTKGKGEVITSELIYYWMVAFNIPFDCERWHLNRLFSLIRICNIKNSKPTKMSKHELATRNRELNAERKAQFNTTG